MRITTAPVRLWRRLDGKRRWLAAGLAAGVAIILLTASVLGFGPATAEPTVLPAKHLSGTDLTAVLAASKACPALDGPRLAGQVMAASGFGDEPLSEDGAGGVAGVPVSVWKQWKPWPAAEATDRVASIETLARYTCQLVGQLRAADVPGDLWRAAVAAQRTGIEQVVAARGVPFDTADHVERVAAYAAWYARQPEFGGVPASLAPDIRTTLPFVKVPDEYVALIVAAGRECADVSAAQIAAQLMAASRFDPRKLGPTGAQGIAQFLPAVWAEYSPGGKTTPWEPKAAIPALGRAMCDLTDGVRDLGEDTHPLALAAFQWGLVAVQQAGRVPESESLDRFLRLVAAYTPMYAEDTRLKPPAPAPTSAAPAPSPTASTTPSRSPSASPPAARFPDPARTYQVQNSLNGKVLDVYGDDNNKKTGEQAQIYRNQRAKDQFWRFVPMDDGSWMIINSYNGLALAVKGASTQNEAAVVQATPGTSDINHRWTLSALPDGSYRILNKNSGKAMELPGTDVATGDSVKVQQYTVEPSGKDQRWLITP